MRSSASTEPFSFVFTACTDMMVWDTLVNESPQGHVFSRSSFLLSLGVTYSCYLVTAEHGQILAGAAILHNDSEMLQAPFEYTPHQGIIFSKYVSSLSQQKRLTIEFRITGFFIESLIKVFSNFSMALSPFFNDLRPFLWHNYGKKSAPFFRIQQRYTGHLSLNSFDLDNYLSSVRSVRRQEYKKTRAVVEVSNDIDLFLKIYEKTFNRQSIEIDKLTLIRIKKICETALSGGYGHLKCAKVDGTVASMAFFVTDLTSAYYLFGANDPDFRFANASTKLLIESIAYFAGIRLSCFDFVGVNSPNRGDFKLSFGAKLVPYQEVHLLNYD